MTAYNTGVTASATNITAATAFTFTVPAGVLTGDVMIVSLNVFSFSSNTVGAFSPTSGGGAWTQIGTTQAGNQGSIEGWGSAWYRVATASDPGSTFTVSWTGTTGGGNQFWWASDLEAYTGFYTASPIGNFATVVSNATSVVAPSTTTARGSSWAIQTCPVSVSGSGSITGEPATNRHVINPGAGVDNAISDSNGSVGAAGTGIGGGTFTLSASSSGAGIAFTIELCTQAASAPVVAAPTPPRIPHPRFLDILVERAWERASWKTHGVASLQQQHWRLMDGASGRPGTGSSGTQPPAAGTSNGSAIVNGLRWYVTEGGQWFEGYWYYVCASGQSTSAQKFALWSWNSATAGGVVVPGSVVTSGALTAGQWNYIPLPQPVQLAIYGIYVAATGVAASAGYPDTGSQFASAQPYAAGITSGPLKAFSDSTGSNPCPNGGVQCITSAGTDPAVTMPAGSTVASDNLWIDVQVTNTPPAGYNKSYRLWPNMADADWITSADSSVNYVVGTELVISQPSVVNAIWYYIPAGQGSSNNQWATSADIWRVRDGVRVATQQVPVWINGYSGGVDGNSNLGRWVYTQLPGTVTLQAGDYYVTVYNGNGSPNGWGAKRFGYWQAYQNRPDGTYQNTPPGTAGITTGPLTAPTTPAASPSYEYNAAGGGSPPNTTGVLEPGQSVFAVGPPNQVPYIYVTGFFQNYWVDLEVTPASTYTPDAPDLPQRLPHPMFTRLLEVAAYRADGAPPPPVTSVSPAAGLATAAGTAQAASVAVAVNAGLATGAGTAQGATAAVAVNAGLATGTGTAQAPVPAIAVNAALASGVATAQNATASTSASGTANAVLASGTGTAQSPVAAIGVNAAAATGTGAAQGATVQTSGSTNVTAVLATAAGTAQSPAAAIAVNAAAATGAGTAQGAGRAATAGLASGTGTAQAAALAVAANAAAANALGAALGITTAVVTPGTLTATTAATATLTAGDQRTGGPG